LASFVFSAAGELESVEKGKGRKIAVEQGFHRLGRWWGVTELAVKK
jgi:hypothetical protein